MFKYRAFGILFMLLLLSGKSWAQQNHAIEAENELKKYMNTVVHQVKNTDDPEAKRTLLNQSLNNLQQAMGSVKKLIDITGEDQEFITSFTEDLQEKQDELNGLDGFTKVQDKNLNDFADYIQQDMEQAQRTVTISVTTALLAALILVLIAS